MTIVIVINGVSRAGKDTFCRYFADIATKSCRQISSVYRVKKAARVLGWNGKKTAKARKLLCDLKKLSVEFNDGPARYVRAEISKARKASIGYLFIHIREPAEIGKISANYRIFLENRRASAESGDEKVGGIEYDFYLDNSGTLQDLRREVARFYQRIAGECSDNKPVRTVTIKRKTRVFRRK